MVKSSSFHLQFFRYRFDDEVRIAYRVLDLTRSGNQGKRLVRVRRLRPFPSATPSSKDCWIQATACSSMGRGNIFQNGVIAPESRGIRDPPPHRPRANHGYRLHAHSKDLRPPEALFQKKTDKRERHNPKHHPNRTPKLTPMPLATATKVFLS